MAARYGKQNKKDDERSDDRAEGDGDDDRRLKKRTQKLLDMYKDSWRGFRVWRAKAEESLRMLNNMQWPDDRDGDSTNGGAFEFEEQGDEERPRLVINKMLGQCLYLLGVEMQNQTEPVLLPVESNDQRGAELMGYLMKALLTLGCEDELMAQLFMDKIATGMSWRKMVLDTDDDGQRPRFERCHPLSVLPDPNFLDSWPHPPRWAFHTFFMPIDEACEAYPDHADRIKQSYGEWLNGETSSTGTAGSGNGEALGDSLAIERTFFDKATQGVRILECWWVEIIGLTVAIDNETGETRSQPEKVEKLKERHGDSGRMSFVKKKVRRCNRSTLVADVLVDEIDSPFDEPEVPIFPDLAFYFSKWPFGVVELMKSLQIEKNKRRSTIVELTTKMAQGGFFNKKEGGALNQDLIDFANGVDPVITYMETQPVPIEPPTLPPTLVYLEQRADEDMRDVSGINRELTGQATQKTVSGKAIVARQRGGMTVQESLFFGERVARRRALKFMIKAIQQYMTVEEALRILGSEAQREVAMQRAPLGEDPALGPVGQVMARFQQLDELQEVLDNTMLVKFDVVIDQSRAYEETARVARWDTLQQIALAFPGSIPPDVMVEAATDAGNLTKSQGMRTLAWIQRKMAAELGQQNGNGATPPTPGSALDQRSEPAAVQ